MLNLPIEIFQMRQNVRRERKKLDRLRLSLLRKQLLRAYIDVPYYTASFNHLGLNPLTLKSEKDIIDYPTITKATIQKDASQFLSIKYADKKCPRSHSSGSTGRPIWVSFDKKSWIRKKYLSKLRTRWECDLQRGQRVAIFDTDPPEVLSKRNQRFFFSNSILRTRYFSVFENLTECIDSLVRWRPDFIDSMPSHLFQLAQIIDRKRIRLPTLKKICTSSEYLEPNMRHFISRAFDAEIFDIYGCTEIKEIAWECSKHEGYHINEDDVLVEVLDGDRPVRPGEMGEIVVTDLRNQAMPLIRYRIGDRGMLMSDACCCGRTFTMMSPSAGRASDFIITPRGHKISPYRLTTAIEKVNGLLQYQFIQIDHRSIVAKVIMADDASAGQLEEIQNKIKAVVEEPMAISVEPNEEIQIEANGKFKVVVNHMPVL